MVTKEAINHWREMNPFNTLTRSRRRHLLVLIDAGTRTILQRQRSTSNRTLGRRRRMSSSNIPRTVEGVIFKSQIVERGVAFSGSQRGPTAQPAASDRKSVETRRMMRVLHPKNRIPMFLNDMRERWTFEVLHVL